MRGHGEVAVYELRGKVSEEPADSSASRTERKQISAVEAAQSAVLAVAALANEYRRTYRNLSDVLKFRLCSSSFWGQKCDLSHTVTHH